MIAWGRRGMLAGLVVVALLLSACGGDDDDDDGQYSFDAARECLEAAGVPLLTEPQDLYSVASGASRGGLVARLAGNEVAIAFERSVEDADEVYGIGRRVSTSIAPADRGYFARRQNVVLHWRTVPTAQVQQTVDDCLE